MLPPARPPTELGGRSRGRQRDHFEAARAVEAAFLAVRFAVVVAAVLALVARVVAALRAVAVRALVLRAVALTAATVSFACSAAVSVTSVTLATRRVDGGGVRLEQRHDAVVELAVHGDGALDEVEVALAALGRRRECGQAIGERQLERDLLGDAIGGGDRELDEPTVGLDDGLERALVGGVEVLGERGGGGGGEVGEVFADWMLLIARAADCFASERGSVDDAKFTSQLA